MTDSSASTGTAPLRRIALDNLRLLCFRRPSAALSQHRGAYLGWGLALTWLAGIGRYWDHPAAHVWQYAGLGSVAYVLLLAAVLWLFGWPMRPRRWSYPNVLLFVCLTAPPALLYAIPVERFLPLDLAQSVNAWFLAIVASWRVALLYWFLRSMSGLRADVAVVAGLLPLALIVVALSMLNLEHAVFEIMAGIAEEARTPNDDAYGIVSLLAILSMMAAPFLLLLYAAYAWTVWRDR